MSMHRLRSFLVVLLAFSLGPALAGSLAAQTTNGTIRGTVTEQGRPLAGTEVVARNVASGTQRTATTRADGGYTLAGMVPATYELTVRRIGSEPQRRLVVVQIGATQIQDFSLSERVVQLTELVVTAPPTAETRTSVAST